MAQNPRRRPPYEPATLCLDDLLAFADPIVVVSLVYSATRHDQWKQILYEAGRWGLRMAAFLGGIALALFLLSTYL